MKNAALIVVIAIGFVVSVAILLQDKEAVTTSAARPWPERMGTL